MHPRRGAEGFDLDRVIAEGQLTGVYLQRESHGPIQGASIQTPRVYDGGMLLFLRRVQHDAELQRGIEGGNQKRRVWRRRGVGYVA
jgi:hypothetical protein